MSLTFGLEQPPTQNTKISIYLLIRKNPKTIVKVSRQVVFISFLSTYNHNFILVFGSAIATLVY